VTSSPAPSQSPTAIQDGSGKIWLAWTRRETGDINIRFVIQTATEYTIPENRSFTILTEMEDMTLVSPSLLVRRQQSGTTLSFDPRIGFIDGNGNNLWDPGEFVVYDPNLNSVYDPKLMYVDSNNDNVGTQGESIVYKANSTVAYFTGSSRCQVSMYPAMIA